MLDRRPKILVEIYTPNGFLMKKKRYPIVQDTVEIRAPRRGAGGVPYRPKYTKDCIINYYSGLPGFKSLKQKLMLIDGADDCVKFVPKNDVELPLWDRTTEQNFFTANVIRAAGASTQKLQIPMSLYLLLIVILGMTFISLLISTGRMRI